MLEPDSSVSTSNSSQALPGSFISAARRKRWSGSNASTRQQSSVSPGRSHSGSRRPRRIPTPPASKSRSPLIRHNQSPKYQPERPPMRRIGSNARDGSSLTRAARESTNREPKRTPPQLAGQPPEEKASDQRVSAN